MNKWNNSESNYKYKGFEPEGMDAIDALLCFGFKLVRTGDCYHLNNHNIDARYYYTIRELFQEIGQEPEFHRALFTQKGEAIGL